MKKTIALKEEYLDTKKLSKSDEIDSKKELFNNSIVEFKKQFKEFLSTKLVKITSENWIDHEITIEFNESAWDKLHQALLKADIVSLIDSSIYDN